MLFVGEVCVRMSGYFAAAYAGRRRRGCLLSRDYVFFAVVCTIVRWGWMHASVFACVRVCVYRRHKSDFRQYKHSQTQHRVHVRAHLQLVAKVTGPSSRNWDNCAQFGSRFCFINTSCLGPERNFWSLCFGQLT